MPAASRRTTALMTLGVAAVLWMAVAPTSKATDAPLASVTEAAFAPQLVTVDTPTRADKDRLNALGLDLTEHAGHDYVEVVLHTAADLATLTGAGFSYDVRIADLLARQAERIALDAAYAEATAVSSLPSGRDSYRVLADFGREIDELVALRPDIAKRVSIGRSVEGRDLTGIEIGQGVNDPEDGRPVFLMFGAHHAREWPSAELPMEFAHDLVRSYGTDPRITDLLNRGRAIIVPVSNPDGFDASRTSGDIVDLRGTEGVPYNPGCPARHAGQRLQAQELPLRRRPDPAGRHLRRRDVARRLRPRRRPQPELRRAVGRPGHQRQPGRPRLPRPGAVLGARDPGHPQPHLDPAGDHGHHQPHVLEPRSCARSASSRAPSRPTATRSASPPTSASPAPAASTTACRRSASGWPRRTATATSSAGSCTTPPARPRTTATTPPAATATRSRSARTSSTRRTRHVVAEYTGDTAAAQAVTPGERRRSDHRGGRRVRRDAPEPRRGGRRQPRCVPRGLRERRRRRHALADHGSRPGGRHPEARAHRRVPAVGRLEGRGHRRDDDDGQVDRRVHLPRQPVDAAVRAVAQGDGAGRAEGHAVDQWHRPAARQLGHALRGHRGRRRPHGHADAHRSRPATTRSATWTWCCSTRRERRSPARTSSRR